jgi:hypothetical protein
LYLNHKLSRRKRDTGPSWISIFQSKLVKLTAIFL